jgi:hypothetical protein
VSKCGGPEDASETIERSSSSSSSDSSSLDNSNWLIISLQYLGERGGGAMYDWSKYTVQPDWQPLLLSSSPAITFRSVFFMGSFFFLLNDEVRQLLDCYSGGVSWSGERERGKEIKREGG